MTLHEFRRLFPHCPNYRWHYERGRFYGFPMCCILWYCSFQWVPDWVYNPPVSIWKRLGMPDTPRQFVPCPYHYTHGMDLHIEDTDRTEEDFQRYLKGIKS